VHLLPTWCTKISLNYYVPRMIIFKNLSMITNLTFIYFTLFFLAFLELLHRPTFMVACLLVLMCSTLCWNLSLNLRPSCFIGSFNVVTWCDRQTACEAPFCETLRLIFKHISDENIFLRSLKPLNVIVLES